MKNFEEIKEDILNKAKTKGSCEEGYDEGCLASNHIELLLVVKKHLPWLVENKVVTAKSLENDFGKEMLFENDIYTSGEHSIVLKDLQSREIKTLGSSQATVKTLDSSQATVETLDSSQATVKTLGSSQATVETLDSSQATIETLDSRSKLNHSLGDGELCTIKDLSSKSIYMKKDKFNIIFL